MARTVDTLDLSRLALSPGEGRRLDLLVGIDRFELGGQLYAASPEAMLARLDVTRTGGGYSLRLRFDVTVAGPCMRCLEDASPRFCVEAREVDQPSGGEDLDSPYVANDDLDLRAWARDALALELPTQIVCRDDCLGICAVCGENLNAVSDHRHEAQHDSRWAKLGELKFD